MAVDFNSVESIIGGFGKVLSLSSIGGPPPIPAPLILIGVPLRPGLSAIKIASRIIARKSEAGLPVGALPSGGASPDEIMERIRIEEIINASARRSHYYTSTSTRNSTDCSRYFTDRTCYCGWCNYLYC